ncbi:putative ribonuclease H-like domain-containing protein [Tanacetum coccineum]
MCDKKNSVLFTETECLVLSPNFKLLDESQVLLKVPRQNNMYSFNLKNVVPSGGLTCLFAKATIDESNLWHRRLSHINFKTLNKLVRGNPVRGLPLKLFENYHTCVTCQKGKQHKASSSRHDIIFAVYACARFQVTPKTSHLHVVKMISRYLKGHPKLGLWYPRDSLFDLEAFSDYDYAGASLDRKSTTGGCQFLGKRLISWKCKIDSLTKSLIMRSLLMEINPNGDVYRSTDDKDADEVPDKGDDDKEGYANNTNRDSTASPSVSTAELSINTASKNINTVADLNKLGNTMNVSPVPSNPKKLYMVYIKLLEPGMRPCLPTYWKIDIEEALLIKLYSSRRTEVISYDAQEISDEFYGRAHFLLRITNSKSTLWSLTRALVKDEELKLWIFTYTDHIRDWIIEVNLIGLWYPMDSPFNLEAFSDSDYIGASLDRKSTIGGCQFLSKRLISRQSKKQTYCCQFYFTEAAEPASRIAHQLRTDHIGHYP